MKNSKEHTKFDMLLGLGAIYDDEEREAIHKKMDSTSQKHPGERHRKDKEHSLWE